MQILYDLMHGDPGSGLGQAPDRRLQPAFRHSADGDPCL